MSILNNSLLLGADAGAAGYQISRSLRFNSADSAYLSRTPASAGNRRTFTVSFWIKKCRNSLSTSQYLLAAGTGTSESTWFAVTFDIGTSTYDELSAGTWTSTGGSTNASLRDSSAWYHIVVSVDTTQATASNRVKTYVNNVLQSTTTVTISQNADLAWNNNVVHYIGARADSGPRNFFDGYIADFHNIDGQALTPSSFAETNATTGQWVPKAYTGTYGTNGFRLDFSDNSAATATTLGKDRAGSNNWTPNNLSVTAGSGNDSLVDTPTSYGTDTGAGGEVRGNYAIFNPLLKATNTTLSNGNLDFVSATGGGVYESAISTIGVSSGKWYAEFLVITGGNDSIAGVTWAPYEVVNGWPGGYANSIGYEAVLGKFYKDGVGGQTVNTYGVNDVIGVALDLDNAAIWFSKNGTWQGTGSPNPATNTSPAYSSLTAGTYFFAAGTGGSGKIAANFGQRPFAYTAPSGFKALCTQNLSAPTITKPSTVMDVALWTGNGSARSITGLGFNPDLVWIKGRSGATDHALYDSVRGTEKRLESNTTDAEVTSDGGVTAFNSDGFSLGTLAQVNTNTATYAGWAFDAGSSTVTNTSGSISSQVRANASAGFSIVTYTGTGSAATVGHGLGVAPAMVIVKNRSTAGTSWRVYHKNLTSASYNLYLDFTYAQDGPSSAFWNDTAPTSTVFSVGTSSGTNESTKNMVAYCFAPVAGYSAFGSYTGNGSADGPFVYLGFRPAVLLVKMSSSTGNWTILDDKRKGYNVDNDPLYPNLASAEGSTDLIDITSNGFKVRTTDASFNTSAGTYIYAAWASSPFAYSRAR